MFYPVESLKRGGRFYLCWVADSWPLRFAAITRRQLWSQDIRELCDELLEVVTMESGRPANRFSLRLSSQLMRGLVRLYERKATVLLSDICMINANVFKNMNKRQDNQSERVARRQLPAGPVAQPARPDPPPVRVEELDEQRLEELIQNSGNIVANIQDITLKEMAIPEFQLPPNDNFGEENPEQALQLLLADRTPELMLQQSGAAHTSALSAAERDQSHDQSHDKSRAPHDQPAMEAVAELDVTLFRKSNAADLQTTFEKDVPELPEVPPPPLPAPTEPIPPQAPMEVEQVPEEIVPEIPAPPPGGKEPEQPDTQEQEQRTRREQPNKRPRREKETETDTELEELEAQPSHVRRKRRVRTSLIVDTRTKLDSDTYRARVANPHVEMRFQDSTDAVISVRPSADALMLRMARAGTGLHSNISPRLARLHQRNLGPTGGVQRTDREDQERQMELLRERRTRSTERALEKIPEVEEPQQGIEPALAPPTAEARAPEGREALQVTTEMLDVTAPALDVSTVNVLDAPSVQDPNQMQVDISDLPTQKLETLSQIARQRTGEYETPAKKQRSMGYISFRESQQKHLQLPEIIIDEPDKENIPPNIQSSEQTERIATEPPSRQPRPSLPLKQPIVLLENLTIPLDRSFIPIEQPGEQHMAPTEQSLAQIEHPLAHIEQPLAQIEQPLAQIEQPLAPIECSQADAARMLQEAGLSDILHQAAPHAQRESEPRKRRSSESSETQLGSLDRTKVSLGDSVHTTDTQRFMRDEWGVEGTMTKLLFLMRARPSRPASVGALVGRGPVLPAKRRMVAARCFSSLLKLKQHGFIRFKKDPSTLEIVDITLGPRFDNM